MELSVLYNFFLSRLYTWSDRPKETGYRLFLQILKFHGGIASTLLLRVALFAILQWVGIYFMYNAAIGIILAAVVNFFIYDTLVFKKEG